MLRSREPPRRHLAHHVCSQRAVTSLVLEAHPKTQGAGPGQRQADGSWWAMYNKKYCQRVGSLFLQDRHVGGGGKEITCGVGTLIGNGQRRKIQAERRQGGGGGGGGGDRKWLLMGTGSPLGGKKIFWV